MKQLKIQNFQNKLRNKFLKSGVKMIGPDTIYFSKDIKIGKNVTIEPFVVFGSKVTIGNNVLFFKYFVNRFCYLGNIPRIGHSNLVISSVYVVNLTSYTVCKVT